MLRTEALRFTWKRTSNPRPRLSANIRIMMLFRMVPKKVLIPNTKAHSSLVRDEAIWKLRRQKGKQTLQEVSECQNYLNHILTDTHVAIGTRN